MKLQLNKEERNLIFEDAISWIVVLAMYAYGLGKFVQFGDTSQNHLPVSELTGMQLMWAFYGYSKPFALVLGVLEILGGTLILIRKTRLLGCLLTSTILVNVILQDIFYEVLQGALRAALIYQSLILVVLWIHREKIKQVFRVLLLSKLPFKMDKRTLVLSIITFILFVVFRMVEYLICNL